MAADVPFGATPVDTGEFLLGTITVTPVFFESDGSIDSNTEDWTAQEIDATLAKIEDSVQWWADLLATKTSVHTLDFVVDETYARNPVQTGYEPITRTSDTFQRYVGSWLTGLGYGDAPSIERAVHLFNDSQRQSYQTDWAFTVFVVDSSNDADGFFADGGFLGAFAYPGGLFMVIPSERPTSTYSHEMGHIFWARDQYPGAGSWTDQRGYYNAQNYNAADNPTPGFVQQDSIMRGGSASVNAFNQLVTEPSALAMVGWQDSDGDGIFDVADVPLTIDAIATFDAENQTFDVTGSAAVDTLANRNSAGMQSDITLARIRELEYRLDGGAWQTALIADDTEITFDLDIDAAGASTLDFRAIDTSTGITSEILSASTLIPAFSGLGGVYAFLDTNENGRRDEGESLFTNGTLNLKRSDGSSLSYQAFDAATLPAGNVASQGGVTLSAVGDDTDGQIAVRTSTTDLSGVSVFQFFDTDRGVWKDAFGADQQLQVSGDQTVGAVVVDFRATDTGGYGYENGSYARVEAYDSAGNLIERVTSPLIMAGETGRVSLHHSTGQIAKVLIFGHAETEILVESIQFGTESIAETEGDGLLAIDGLAVGQYQLETTADNLIYQFSSTTIPLELNESMNSVALPVFQVDSPRFNQTLPGDTNGDGMVSVRDALVVINDIARLGNRTLGPDELSGFDVDVNNDGVVSPIDALRVINLLSIARTEGEIAEGESVSSADSTMNSQAVDDYFASSASLQTASASSNPLAVCSVDWPDETLDSSKLF
ncbi:dockerin type I domain-containing protein [Roseiconus lacunae]|uniref:dockerin type I domain-containing protein n=1 Tax=Roseiconus lacunae TaxID=2605694 RepID=UPI00308E1CCB|nr:dockerin type I domain-containing protein [Stieleria sp. HD01]